MAAPRKVKVGGLAKTQTGSVVGKTGPAAFPAIPAAVSPFKPQAMQPDATFIAQQGVNLSGYGNTLAGLANQEQGVRQAYGFDDLSDPFSRARLLDERYQNRNRSNTNSFAGSGQLYSGALQNAQNQSALQNTQDVNTARNQYQADLNTIAQNRANAQLSLSQGGVDAFGQMVERQLANRPAGDPVAAPKVTVPKVQTGTVKTGKVTGRTNVKPNVLLNALKKKGR